LTDAELYVATTVREPAAAASNNNTVVVFSSWMTVRPVAVLYVNWMSVYNVNEFSN